MISQEPVKVGSSKLLDISLFHSVEPIHVNALPLRFMFL